MSYAERSSGKLTGRWVCDAEFKHPDGSKTRWHKAFKTKQEADGAEAYYRATGERPPHLSKGPSNSFAAVADRFAARNPDWVAARDNRQRLEMAKTCLGAIDIRMVRTAELERYVDTLRARCGFQGRPPANNTINNYLNAVSVVLRYANKLDMIDGVPEVPRLPLAGKTRAAVSVAMETAICNRLAAQGKADSAFLVRVLAGTGMRRGELYALTRDQIETPEQVENTGWLLTPEQTKTNAARWVPILPEAAKKLRTMIAFKKLPIATRLSKDFKDAAKELGDTQGLTLHCLRHTTATRLEETGADALIIAKLLGHSTGLMTSRYFKPSKARLFEVATKVQNGLGETPKTADILPIQRLDNTA